MVLLLFFWFLVCRLMWWFRVVKNVLDLNWFSVCWMVVVWFKVCFLCGFVVCGLCM